MLAAASMLLALASPNTVSVIPPANVNVNLPDTFGQELNSPPRPGCDDDNPPHCQDDPLLSAKLKLDDLNSASLDVLYSRHRSARRLQIGNFDRRFKRRRERVYEEFRRQYGEEILSHGHDIILIARYQPDNIPAPAMPSGWQRFNHVLLDTERFLGIASNGQR